MRHEVDRRKLLKGALVGSAATGIVWTTPSVLGSSSAFAAGSCLDYTLAWGTQTFSPSMAEAFGATNTMTIAYVDPSGMVATTGTYPSGIDGTFARTGAPYSYHIQLNGSAGTGGTSTTDGSAVVITISFATAVTNLSFSVLDVDSQTSPAYRGTGTPPAPLGWVDRINVTAVNGASSVSGIGAPGATVTTDSVNVKYTGGTNVANAGTSTGDVAFSFVGPVTKVTINYIRAGLVATQGIGISNITACST